MTVSASDQLDYSIYIDPDKAFIFSMNPFDAVAPVLTRIELNIQPIDQPYESIHTLQPGPFIERIISLLQAPNRLLIFGPSDDKYTLFKVIQNYPLFTNVEKTVLVARLSEQPAHAQIFSDHFFSLHLPF